MGFIDDKGLKKIISKINSVINSFKGQVNSKFNTLYEEINNRPYVENITYLELVDLRTSGKLIPGRQYRIIDYVTTTSQEDTRSAGHGFNIIVTALDKNTLSEEAKAIQKSDIKYVRVLRGTSSEVYQVTNTIAERGQRYKILKRESNNASWSQELYVYENSEINLGCTVWDFSQGKKEYGVITEGEDLYFANNTLNRWKLNYCLDNNVDKFSWAGFLTIDTNTYKLTIDGVTENLTLTFANNVGAYNWYRFEHSKGVVFTTTQTPSADTKFYDGIYGNVIDATLTYDMILGGTGVIYYMKDEFGNEAPYDFKNIQFKRCKVTSDLEGADLTTLAQEYVGYSLSGYGASMPLHISLVDESDYKYVYTFSCVNNGSIVDASLGASGIACYDNSMKPYIASNVQHLNDIVMYAHPESGNHCITKNTFASDCFSMTLGCEQVGEVWDNHFGQYCKSNIILGPYVYQNDFGANLTACYFSQQVIQNNIGSYMQRNFVNNTFVQNVLGPNCKDNIFMKKCSLNTIGEQFMNNTCNDEFYQNNLGAGFLENTFNGKFYSNVSYNQFMRNTINGQCNHCDFGTQCTGNTLGIFRNSKVGSLFMSNVMCDTMACVFGIGFNCNNVTATRMQCSTFGTYVMYNNWTSSGDVKNIKVSDNLQGTTSSYNNIELPADSLCEIKVSRNSAGDIKIYCAADFDKQIEDAITTVINTEV